MRAVTQYKYGHALRMPAQCTRECTDKHYFHRHSELRMQYFEDTHSETRSEYIIFSIRDIIAARHYTRRAMNFAACSQLLAASIVRMKTVRQVKHFVYTCSVMYRLMYTSILIEFFFFLLLKRYPHQLP